MNRKKILSLILGVMCIASIFTGCNKAEAKKGEPVTIKCAVQSLPTIQQTEIEEYIDKFHQEHTNIKIELQDISGNYNEELNSRIEQNTEPDLFMLDDMSAANYASQGKLLAIDNLVDEKELNDFNDNLLNQFKINGKLYGLPAAGNTMALFYNKDMFDSEGLKPPTTWSELEFAAKKFTKGDNVGLAVEYEPIYFIPFMIQGGGKISDGSKLMFNDEGSVKGLNFFDSLFKRKIAANSEGLFTDSVIKAFMGKKAAMCIGFSGEASYVSDYANINWDTAPLPRGDQEGGFFQANGIVVSGQTKHSKEAVEVLKFFSSKEVQGIIAESAIAVPARKSMQQQYIKSHPKMEAFITMLNKSTPISYGENIGKVMSALGNAASMLYSGKVPDAKQALDEAIK